jgi:hypothetical protein
LENWQSNIRIAAVLELVNFNPAFYISELQLVKSQFITLTKQLPSVNCFQSLKQRNNDEKKMKSDGQPLSCMLSNEADMKYLSD